MLRPIDIQNKSFDRKIKGYDPDQVDDFLDRVIHDYEAVLKENQTLNDKLATAEESLTRYRKIESTMESMIAASRQTADEVIENAKVQADNMLERARLSAQKLATGIDQEHTNKQLRLEAMQKELDGFRMRIKAMCDGIVDISERM